MSRGKFVVIEGIDYSGKTTICSRLRNAGSFSPVEISEPGTTELGEMIRRIVKSPEECQKLSGAETLHYFFTARISVLVDVIAPILCREENVLTDRFDASTYAYQVAAGSNGKLADIFWLMRELYIEDPNREPDLYILLDLDPDLALARMPEGKTRDYYDSKGSSYFRRVRQGYHDFVKDGIPYVSVDASKHPDEVYENVLAHVVKALAPEPAEEEVIV